ncbi:MAG: RAD55 family ATPase [Cetobacterium sp.]
MAKKKVRLVPLSEDLEKLALCAVMRGVVPDSEVHEDELSKLGKLVLKAIRHLRSYEDAPEELPVASIQATAAEILGADHNEVRTYTSSCFALASGREAGDLLRAVRQKSILVDILNEAGNQLATGAMDLGKIAETLATEDEGARTLSSASDLLINGLPQEPTGLHLKTLPLISEASGGLMGMWAVASEAGVGKSTLAVQLAVEYNRIGPVLYYDMENGPEVMLYRIGKRYGGDVDKARLATKNIYFRESIRTLSEDLRSMKNRRCLVVIDSLQKLPTSADNRRVSLDLWVHRFERLKKQGHTIVLISEKNREQYGAATQRGFKETGEIEYSADFGFHLLPEKGMDTMSKVIIVKNRHRPHSGSVCYLERVNGFRFVERT